MKEKTIKSLEKLVREFTFRNHSNVPETFNEKECKLAQVLNSYDPCSFGGIIQYIEDKNIRKIFRRRDRADQISTIKNTVDVARILMDIIEAYIIYVEQVEPENENTDEFIEIKSFYEKYKNL
ncbi:MAG: hypothetical protein Q4G05_05560 [Clostridia bacterium]|nr:hypothetical protein [Clostridia bacterium]